MTPRHAADRALARVRAWWTERRADREAAEDAAAEWFDELADRQLPKRRLPNRHRKEADAKPGDFPGETGGGLA